MENTNSNQQPNGSRLKTRLRWAALLILAAALLIWAVQGANRGWTKTSQAVKTLDPVTGIEGITYTRKFSPGIDFLGAAILLSTALGAGAIFVRTKPS